MADPPDLRSNSLLTIGGQNVGSRRPNRPASICFFPSRSSVKTAWLKKTPLRLTNTAGWPVGLPSASNHRAITRACWPIGSTAVMFHEAWRTEVGRAGMSAASNRISANSSAAAWA